MCGRFAAHYRWSEVNAFSRPLTVTTPEPDPSPSYNIAPTQAAWVVIPDGNKLVASTMRWGLIPRWSQDGKPSFSSINARIETVSEKPAFREPWQRNRCLIPVSGYYEWSGIKQPYYIRGEGPILMLGGIFETWRSSGGAFIESFSILTQPRAVRSPSYTIGGLSFCPLRCCLSGYGAMRNRRCLWLLHFPIRT